MRQGKDRATYRTTGLKLDPRFIAQSRPAAAPPSANQVHNLSGTSLTPITNQSPDPLNTPSTTTSIRLRAPDACKDR